MAARAVSHVLTVAKVWVDIINNIIYYFKK